MSAEDAIYRVQFKTEQHYYDLYVRHVFPADMAGFICLEGFLFHEETQVLIDPRVERLTAEFGDVSTAFVAPAWCGRGRGWCRSRRCRASARFR